jgi:hypothetical protein
MADALRSAGATEEIVALMQSCFDACIKPGRPRQYPNRTEKQRAYRARRKQREKSSEVKAIHAAPSLRVRLIDASNGNIDALADISPIRALMEQGCDLEADILPVVARLTEEPVEALPPAQNPPGADRLMQPERVVAEEGP